VPDDVAALVRKILGNRFSDQAMRRQAIALARENLKQAGVAGALAETLPQLQGEDRVAATEALAALATIPEALAVTVVQGAAGASAPVQFAALRVADGAPSWSPALVDAVRPYLEDRIDRRVRLALCARLAKGPDAIVALPALSAILRTEPDRAARLEALEVLAKLPRASAMDQLDWTIAKDSDDRIRARARAIRDGVEAAGEGVAALSCPKCGGRIPAGAAGRFRCDFCGSTLEL
jgi:hypothetical protein